MSQRLERLVAAVFERPTLEGLDELLAELEALPRDQAVAGLIDDLLDYRVVLPERVAPSERVAPAERVVLAELSARGHVNQDLERVVDAA
jgi:hypothetical protein